MILLNLSQGTLSKLVLEQRENSFITDNTMSSYVWNVHASIYIDFQTV